MIEAAIQKPKKIGGTDDSITGDAANITTHNLHTWKPSEGVLPRLAKRLISVTEEDVHDRVARESI